MSKETKTAPVAVAVMEKPKPYLRLQDEDIDTYLGDMPKVGDEVTLTVTGKVTSVEDRTDNYDGKERRLRSVSMELAREPGDAEQDDDGAVYKLKAKMQERGSVK